MLRITKSKGEDDMTFLKKHYKLVLAIFSLLLLTWIVWKEPIASTLNSQGLPLTGHVIVIDPGHGGVDGGAKRDGVVEKGIALNISRYLRDYLQEQGATVIMVREKDKDLAPKSVKGLSKRKTIDLLNRAKIINHSNADMFISVHLNAIPNGRWHGAQVLYNNKYGSNKILAESLQSELVRTLENTDREAHIDNDLFIMRTANPVGALAEVGFLSNDTERQLLQNKEYQQKVAFALYAGITRYYSTEIK